MHLAEPVFPPLLSGHPVKAPSRAFETAVAGVSAGRLGAGDLVWGRDTGRLDCAVVLEPETSAERAVEMVPVTMVAFGDCLAALAPPQVAITYRWPAEIRVNGGRVGSVRGAMSARRDEAGVPRWLVVGLDVVIRHDARAGEPGERPDETALAEEGCSELDRTMLVESFARHLLSWIHAWEAEGFRGAHELFLGRSENYRDEVEIVHAGTPYRGRFVGLDAAGNLLLRAGDDTHALALLDAVETVGAPETA